VAVAGDQQWELTCAVESPPCWELFLVNHSHVDIGYTEYPDILADAHGDDIAWALATPRGQVYLDVPGGAMRPGLDQVDRTATDGHSIQDWFAVAEDDYAIVMASPDVPPVQCSGINTGAWRERAPASNGVVMVWRSTTTGSRTSQSSRVGASPTATALPYKTGLLTPPAPPASG